MKRIFLFLCFIMGAAQGMHLPWRAYTKRALITASALGGGYALTYILKETGHSPKIYDDFRATPTLRRDIDAVLARNGLEGVKVDFGSYSCCSPRRNRIVLEPREYDIPYQHDLMIAALEHECGHMKDEKLHTAAVVGVVIVNIYAEIKSERMLKVLFGLRGCRLFGLGMLLNALTFPKISRHFEWRADENIPDDEYVLSAEFKHYANRSLFAESPRGIQRWINLSTHPSDQERSDRFAERLRMLRDVGGLSPQEQQERYHAKMNALRARRAREQAIRKESRSL